MSKVPSMDCTRVAKSTLQLQGADAYLAEATASGRPKDLADAQTLDQHEP